MLFGDEKRFQKQYVAHSLDNRIHGVKATATDDCLGPGCYNYNDGMIKKSFSRRQPMTPPASQRKSLFGRNDSFTTGVLTSYGTLSAPMSPRDVLSAPGPGYYEKSVFNFANTSSSQRLSPNGRALSSSRSSPRGSRPTSANNSVAGMSQQSIPLSTSKRFLFDRSATLKDGVLFLSAENNTKETGPGYYSYNLDTLNKPSFNTRAKSPSPNKTLHTVSSPRSTTSSSRPRSVSSGRLRNY